MRFAHQLVATPRSRYEGRSNQMGSIVPSSCEGTAFAVLGAFTFYLNHQMHDLHIERFTTGPGDGPIKSFTLRGINDSPPYLHDGRCLTLEDTVGSLISLWNSKLSAEEKTDLVMFMRQL
jgi:hypothetical protein